MRNCINRRLLGLCSRTRLSRGASERSHDADPLIADRPRFRNRSALEKCREPSADASTCVSLAGRGVLAQCAHDRVCCYVTMTESARVTAVEEKTKITAPIFSLTPPCFLSEITRYFSDRTRLSFIHFSIRELEESGSRRDNESVSREICVFPFLKFGARR